MQGSGVRLVHFNDAYTATGTASRLKTLIDDLSRDKPTLVTCAGDVFNPSLLSTLTKGKHVPALLRLLRASVFTVGNHDCDFGLAVLAQLAASSGGSWVLSNISPQLDGTVAHAIVELGGVRIAFFGLAGTDFIGTLNFDASAMTLEDPVACATRLAAMLRSQADTVVAITHQREFDDERVARANVVDLILGGHDHSVVADVTPGQSPVGKGGCDFKHAVVADYDVATRTWALSVRDVVPSLAADAEVEALVESWKGLIDSYGKKTVARLMVDLDLRTCTIRTQESLVANMMADMVRASFVTVLGRPVDAVIINCGTFRGDNRIAAGDFTLSHLLSILPFNDLMLAYECAGAVLLEALEGVLRSVPRENGGFPAVCAGTSITWRRGKIVRAIVNGIDILEHPEHRLVIVTKTYLAEGRDGYEVFGRPQSLRPLMDKDCSILLSSLVRSRLGFMAAANALADTGDKRETRAANRWLGRSHNYHLLPQLSAALEGRIVLEP